MAKLNSVWKQFVAKMYKDHVIGSKAIDSGQYWGLCGMFFRVARDRSVVDEFDGYNMCENYCSTMIARYRHKPVEHIPWNDSIDGNPSPRLRFIAYEARRLGIA